MNIAHLLGSVQRPSRYTGVETNARRKNWQDADVRFCLCFPDLYEVGMSHLGLHILYHILNDLPWVLADRVYAPDPDMEHQMRESSTPLWAVESRRPVSQFDILGITLPYELCYTNIPTVLSLSSIPFYSKDRRETPFPLVLGGGSASVQPEPVADFFDAVLIGDGEEAIVEIAQRVKDCKGKIRDKDSKSALLEILAGIEGIYVPSFYRPIYRIQSNTPPERWPSEPGSQKQNVPPVKRRILPELDSASFPIKPLVPQVKIVHDRFGVEIARGCTRGCRFCQAGMIYRPVRERAFETISGLCEAGLKASGWEELSLLSLSTGDYSSIQPLIARLMDRDDRVSVSLPSLRVGTLGKEMVDSIKQARKTGFTLAPEAGSERMRQVINKGITEKGLFETARIVYENGWKGLKLYFMIGLPTETDDDVLAIAELARRLVRLGKSINKSITVTISVGTFVPKSHTPFQWEGQISIEESRRRLELIRSNLKDRSIIFKWHNPVMSFLEGVFSRGDRRLTRLLELVWHKGARLDAWSDHLRFDLYEDAARELGIDLAAYLEPISVDAELAWRYIFTGVTTDYLRSERQKAIKMADDPASVQELYTPDCRHGKCQGCGVCDFKKIKPRSFEPVVCYSATAKKTRSMSSEISLAPLEKRNRYQLHYSKIGDARFIGHLDMAHMFHRACRRAALPLLYSHGFHPMPYLSFGSPLSMAMEGLSQKLGMELEISIDSSEIISRLNQELSPGVRLTSCQKLTGDERISFEDRWDYFFLILQKEPADICRMTDNFNVQDVWEVDLEKKGKIISFDLKKQIKELAPLGFKEVNEIGELQNWLSDIEQEYIYLQEKTFLKMKPSFEVRPSAKPIEMIKSIFGLSQSDCQRIRVVRRDFDCD